LSPLGSPLLCALSVPKNEKEPETQTLPLPPEPPSAVVAETGKLAFHVSPLSAKGLLTQQIHDAIKALDRANKWIDLRKAAGPEGIHPDFRGRQLWELSGRRCETEAKVGTCLFGACAVHFAHFAGTDSDQDFVRAEIHILIG
jgi:hypothetical protein